MAQAALRRSWIAGNHPDVCIPVSTQPHPGTHSTMDCGSLMPPPHSPCNLPTTSYLDRISLVLGHYRSSRHQLKTPTEPVWYHDGPFHVNADHSSRRSLHCSLFHEIALPLTDLEPGPISPGRTKSMLKKLQGRLDAQWGSVKERCQRAGREKKRNTGGLDSRFEDTSIPARTTEGSLSWGSLQLKSASSGRKRERSDQEDTSRKKVLNRLCKTPQPDKQCAQCGQSIHCRCPRWPPYVDLVCGNCKNRTNGQAKAVEVRPRVHPK
jgi:hypothetical protein